MTIVHDMVLEVSINTWLSWNCILHKQKREYSLIQQFSKPATISYYQYFSMTGKSMK